MNNTASQNDAPAIADNIDRLNHAVQTGTNCGIALSVFLLVVVLVIVHIVEATPTATAIASH